MFCEFFGLSFLKAILHVKLVTCINHFVLFPYKLSCSVLQAFHTYWYTGNINNRVNTTISVYYINIIVLILYCVLVRSEFALCSCYSGLTCWQHSVQPELVQSVDGTKHTIKWSTNLVTRLKIRPKHFHTQWEHWRTWSSDLV